MNLMASTEPSPSTVLGSTLSPSLSVSLVSQALGCTSVYHIPNKTNVPGKINDPSDSTVLTMVPEPRLGIDLAYQFRSFRI